MSTTRWDNREHCDYCGRDGHNKEGCFKRIGYPKWWPGKGKQDSIRPEAGCGESDPNVSPLPNLNSEQYHALLRYLAEKENKEDDWILDSGCTEYITQYAEWLDKRRASTSEPSVLIPNGESVPVSGKGNSRLPNGIIIKDVLHVPKFKCNILSVSKLSREHQCSITFYPDFCFMQDLRSRELIGAGKCISGLYRIKAWQSERCAMVVTVGV